MHVETGVPPEELAKLNAKGLLRRIPRDEQQQGMLTSIGSVTHSKGECWPCLFWFRGTCSKSIRCGHCHFVHAGSKHKRIRPSKSLRAKLRGDQSTPPVQDVQYDHNDFDAEVPDDDDGLSPMSRRTPQAKAMVLSTDPLTMAPGRSTAQVNCVATRMSL
uniref:C3H1-type domain-containing protein n=1 Tax=Zooxanthella nutricula TaxID=1333877 RepID=A0A7S2MRB3_9DINO